MHIKPQTARVQSTKSRQLRVKCEWVKCTSGQVSRVKSTSGKVCRVKSTSGQARVGQVHFGSSAPGQVHFGSSPLRVKCTGSSPLRVKCVWVKREWVKCTSAMFLFPNLPFFLVFGRNLLPECAYRPWDHLRFW